MIFVDSSVWIDYFNGMIIGTFCIENGHTLLHHDKDFEPLAKHLNLKVLRLET